MKFKSEEDKAKFTRKVQKNKGKLPCLDEILKMIKKGMSQTEIAEKFGVTRQSVSKAINIKKI